MGFDALIARPAPPPVLRILGRSLHGVVSWNINDTCNYRCSYCTQRFMPERTYKLEEVQGYIGAFANLPGDWEIKLSGGEPFTQPGLDEICRGLIDQGHVISVTTNFSVGAKRLERFLEATRGALHVFSASLHLQYATVTDFLARYQIVRAYEAAGVQFCVTAVATPALLERLRDEVAPAFAAARVRFKVQPEKVRGRLRPYSAEQLAILDELGGHNRTGDIAHDFSGRPCWAGARYLVIKSDGRASRCYPASRHGGRYAQLGSFLDGIKLHDGPRLCPYTYCNCTVPIERGMIGGISGDIATAALESP